jgi:hypothetical protein
VEHQIAGVFLQALWYQHVYQAQEIKTKNKTEMKNKKLIEGRAV